jgi:hypothetical protein
MWWWRRRGKYHITQVPPLVQKVPVHIDTVGLGKVFGDQLPYRREALLFLCSFVLDVFELDVVCRNDGFGLGHSWQKSHDKTWDAEDSRYQFRGSECG